MLLPLALGFVCALLATATPAAIAEDAPAKRTAVRLGETLRYDVRFGPFRVGEAWMRAEGIETVRGMRAVHAAFGVKGRALFYSVEDSMESWFDPDSLVSYRFHQDLHEGSRERRRRIEVYPAEGLFVEDDGPPEATSPEPLDEVSFLYFLRRYPFTVGQDLTFDRYFRPSHNPFRVRVAGRETVEVPAGRFECLVLRPEVEGRGIFRKGGEAWVWLSDDERRLLVKVTSSAYFGTLRLLLRHTDDGPAVTPGSADEPESGRPRGALYAPCPSLSRKRGKRGREFPKRLW